MHFMEAWDAKKWALPEDNDQHPENPSGFLHTLRDRQDGHAWLLQLADPLSTAMIASMSVTFPMCISGHFRRQYDRN
jgi:hypothetical protein